MGVANFVGPDELVKEMGNKAFDSSMSAYSTTPEGKKYWSEVMSGVDGGEQQMNNNSNNDGGEIKDKAKGFAKDIIKDIIGF